MLSSSAANPWQPLAEYILPCTSDSERLAMAQVAGIVQTLPSGAILLPRLRIALAAALGNCAANDRRRQGKATLLLQVNVSIAATPTETTENAAGKASPGWGFFLIERMVEAAHDDLVQQHVIELYLYQEADSLPHTEQ